MIEETLRAELTEHMGGASPMTDWAMVAERSTQRRHRWQVVGTIAGALALAGIVLGAVALPQRSRPQNTGSIAPQPPVSTDPATAGTSPTALATPAAGSQLVIVDSTGVWSLAARMTSDEASAVCLDLTRVGLTKPISACTSDSSSVVSYHHAAITVDGSLAVVEFGLVPHGTTSVTLVSGTGAVAAATLIPLSSDGAVMWAVRNDTEAVSAVAHEANGTTVDLLSAQEKTCPGIAAELPEIQPCPAATPPTTPTTTVQSGYDHDETFCSTRGELHYLASHGSVTLTSTLTGLPAGALLGFNWINNTVRGYNIAAERTTAGGAFDAATLDMFRPGEVRGVAMQVTDGDTVIVRLLPC